MAKTRNVSPRAVKSRQDMSTAAPAGPPQRPAGRLEGFAEDLGRLLGTTERKAAEWLNQRQTVVQQLTAIRDKAGDLLQQLGQRETPFSTATSQGRAARKGSARGAKKAGRRKRRAVSPETRAKMAAAARARWAKRKQSKPGS